jgi:hypothetical protein
MNEFEKKALVKITKKQNGSTGNSRFMRVRFARFRFNAT